MNSILYLALVLASFVPNAPDLPESFSLKSLDALDAQCPEFRKDASDAILSFTCYENSRSLILSKALIFDGRSFIQDPDTHAKKILVDVRYYTRRLHDKGSNEILRSTERFLREMQDSLYFGGHQEF
ncbi:hypothetical protein HJA83_14540 [Rhizobium bangladeshense]|uniref:hypothetical protein n=1 Tax=Rhizobium bangladeshense TaxID=1138189 RepID=UPI001C83A97A|nr:hypothetical protein [Rhizobium bangladeshense]MBX4902531.1 hypothetical protein [Rhizobium bangladeshense]